MLWLYINQWCLVWKFVYYIMCHVRKHVSECPSYGRLMVLLRSLLVHNIMHGERYLRYFFFGKAGRLPYDCYSFHVMWNTVLKKLSCFTFLHWHNSNSLLAATDYTPVTFADHDLPARLCFMIIVCPLRYSGTTYFEISMRMMNVFWKMDMSI
jgi:hypothetical protein